MVSCLAFCSGSPGEHWLICPPSLVGKDVQNLTPVGNTCTGHQLQISATIANAHVFKQERMSYGVGHQLRILQSDLNS